MTTYGETRAGRSGATRPAAVAGMFYPADARTLERDVDGITASGPTKMKQAEDAFIGLINAIVWSTAVIALIVTITG